MMKLSSFILMTAAMISLGSIMANPEPRNTELSFLAYPNSNPVETAEIFTGDSSSIDVELPKAEFRRSLPQ